MKKRSKQYYFYQQMEEEEEDTYYIGTNDVLYRAVTYETNPLSVEYDPHTAKFGCYFSLGHPCLADSTAIKLNKQLYRYKYMPRKTIALTIGRYGHEELPEGQQNVSHYDPTTNSHYINTRRFDKAEVFLTVEDMNKLRRIGMDIITPTEIARTYEMTGYTPTKQNIFKELAEEIFCIINNIDNIPGIMMTLGLYVTNNICFDNFSITEAQFLNNIQAMLENFLIQGVTQDEIGFEVCNMVREMIYAQPPPNRQQRTRTARGPMPRKFRRVAG